MKWNKVNENPNEEKHKDTIEKHWCVQVLIRFAICLGFFLSSFSVFLLIGLALTFWFIFVCSVRNRNSFQIGFDCYYRFGCHHCHRRLHRTKLRFICIRTTILLSCSSSTHLIFFNHSLYSCLFDRSFNFVFCFMKNTAYSFFFRFLSSHSF